MTLSPQRLDKAAEAMSAKRAELQHLPLARIYDELSLAAISAYLGDTHVDAPREPTEAMLNAGDSMMPQIASGQDITTGYDALRDAWPAMLSAELTERDAG